MEVNFYEMYLEEMALIPVLEAEEEEKVLALAATGDKEAKKRLVEGSLAKVAQMVKEYEGRELPMSDVVQEANVALTAAAAAYDGSQQWQEFLAQEIRQAVEAALEEQKTEAEIEENMTARVNVLQTVSQVMAKELGREATVAELAEKMKMTEDEVKKLCAEYQMNYEETKAWYDGYHLRVHQRTEVCDYAMYNPKSVVEAMMRHKYGTYWNRTETYEALKVYIQMNMDGLKDAVIEMLGGESVRVNTGTFMNDMTTFATRDDVLTLLVHLGYLTYDSDAEKVSIPNREVAQEYVNAVSTMDWHEVARSIEASRKLLEALWKMDEAAVAKGVEQAHKEISVLQYNNENALSCTINLAFYFAREYYTIVRELPTGKGFADIVMIPRKLHIDKPAVVIELKWDKSVSGAIEQIKRNEYIDVLRDYKGNLLLAGINYSKKTKKHTCMIEQVQL